MDDTWTIIQKRITALSGLYNRMDATRDLVYMAPYSLMDWAGKKKLTHVVNVTGNKGASHIHRIVSSLIDTHWQNVVEGDITGLQARHIEQFLDDNLAQTDIYLKEEYGITSLNDWLCNHVCVRGPIGVQWMSYIDEEEYKIHCLPADMRWTPFVMSRWVAPITFRTKDDLDVELEKYAKRAEAGGGIFEKFKIEKETDIEVRDYWSAEKNELWIERKKVFWQPNTSGIIPFVIVMPPSGFMLRDKGYMAYESEDALFLIRNLIGEMNRNLSVEQTFAFRQLYPAYEREVPPEEFDAMPPEPAPKTGETKKTPTGQRAQVVETGDMNRASQVARQDILSMIDEGAPLQPKSYNQPPPAITVATEVELLNQLQYSRVQGLKVFRENLCRHIIEMFLKLSGEVSVGKRGKKRQYSVSQIKDPEKYTIECQQMSKNKRLEIVNEARALAMWGKAPMKYILRDILKVEDPDGWMREMELEEARRSDPVIALLDMAVKYVEEADEIDDPIQSRVKRLQAKMLTERGVALIKQRKMPVPEGAPAPETGREKSNANPLTTLAGVSGQTSTGGLV